MANTITIAGKHVNKWYVYGGIGGVVVVGVLYLKNRNSSSSAGSGDPNAIDPVTGLPYSQDNQVDPATGMTYLAEAEQYGSVSSAETAVQAGFGGGNAGGVSGVSGQGFGFPTGTATGTSVQAATNADWAQEVIAALPSVTGDSQSSVATAVANYLAGLPLTSTQANDIQVALAEFGPPPTGSFSIIMQGSGSGPTGTGTPPPSGGSGGGSGSSGRLSAPTGVHLTIDGKTGVRVQWNPVSGATSYVVLCKRGGVNGVPVNGPFTVTQPVANFGGLQAGTSYTAFIWPSDASDHGGPGSNQPHAQISFSTPK